MKVFDQAHLMLMDNRKTLRRDLCSRDQQFRPPESKGPQRERSRTSLPWEPEEEVVVPPWVPAAEEEPPPWAPEEEEEVPPWAPGGAGPPWEEEVPPPWAPGGEEEAPPWAPGGGGPPLEEEPPPWAPGGAGPPPPWEEEVPPWGAGQPVQRRLRRGLRGILRLYRVVNISESNA